MHTLMISNRRTEAAEACATLLTDAFGGEVSWLPDERRFIDGALGRLTGSHDTVLVCGGDLLGPGAHLAAALRDAIQAPLPGFGEALRRRLEEVMGPRAMLVHAPAGSIGSTGVFALPLSSRAVEEAIALLKPSLPTYRRHLSGEELEELPPVEADDTAPAETAPAGSDALPVVTVPDADIEDVPEGLSITAMPTEEPPPEPEALASGWRAGLRALGGRLDREIWAKIPEELAHVAAAKDLLERAGQRAAVFLPDGRMMAAFGFPDLQRDHSKVLLVGDGAPVAEVIALHRHPTLAGLTVWGSQGILESADADPAEVAEKRLGRAPAESGELFAVDHDAIYLQRGGSIFRWDGRSQDREGSEGQAIASLLLRWSQR